LQLQHQTVLMALLWVVNQVSSPSRMKRRRSRKKYMCLNLKDVPCVPLASCESGQCIIIRIHVRHLMSCEGTLNDISHPCPGRFGAAAKFAPSIPAMVILHGAAPTDQQPPYDQAIQQLIRKRKFIISFFLPLLDVALCIFFSWDSCHES